MASRSLPVLLSQASDRDTYVTFNTTHTHYARDPQDVVRRFGWPDTVVSLCGRIKVRRVDLACGVGQEVVEEPSTRLPQCRICLRIAKGNPMAVRTATVG